MKMTMILVSFLLMGCQPICILDLEKKGISREEAQTFVSRVSSSGMDITFCDARKYFEETGKHTLNLARKDFFEVVIKNIGPHKNKVFRCIQAMISFELAEQRYNLRKDTYIKSLRPLSLMDFFVAESLYDDEHSHELQAELDAIRKKWGNCT